MRHVQKSGSGIVNGVAMGEKQVLRFAQDDNFY